MVKCSGHYVYRNNNDDTPYNRICKTILNTNGKSYVAKCLMMNAGGYSCALSTVYASYWMGTKTSTISAKIPFIEPDSDTEFYMNYTFQWVVFAHSFLLYSGIETAMSLFENFATVAPELIQLEFTDTIDMYEKKELSELQFRVAFRNSLVQLQDYDR